MLADLATLTEPLTTIWKGHVGGPHLGLPEVTILIQNNFNSLFFFLERQAKHKIL